MLSRLRSFLNDTAAARRYNVHLHSSAPHNNHAVRGRASRSRHSQPPPPPPGTQTQTQVPTGTAAGAQTPPAFDPKKLMRGAFMVLGAGFFLSRALTDPNNPDSLVNRALNPRGKNKFQLKVERLEDTLASYDSAFIGASKGVKQALQNQSRHQLSKMLGAELDSLTDEQLKLLTKAGKEHRIMHDQIVKEIANVRDQQLQLLSAQGRLFEAKDDALKRGETDSSVAEAAKKLPSEEELKKKEEKLVEMEKQLRAQMLKYLEAKMELEMNLMRNVQAVLTAEQKSRMKLGEKPDWVANVKNALLGVDGGKYEVIMEKIANMAALPGYEKKRVFVLKFNGDMYASQVSKLREEITAVLSLCDASRGDSVVVQLNSGGGTVTGYGLGAAQLQRLKDAKLPLTVVVDEVAASGGYMMACVADKIVASSFAVLGSVGVVATIPNFSERMQREGVAVEDVTAGKYKRTLTPYKKPTVEDRAKVKSDVENVLTLFKGFVKNNRPQLNIEEIATGETWHGVEALKLGLVDELRTLDDVLLSLRANGADIYTLSLQPVQPRLFDSDSDVSLSSSLIERVKDWVTASVVSAVQGVLSQALLGGSPSSSMGLTDTDAERMMEREHAAVAQRVLAIDANHHPRL